VNDQDVLVAQATNRAIMVRNQMALASAPDPIQIDTRFLEDQSRWMGAGGQPTTEAGLLQSSWLTMCNRLVMAIGTAIDGGITPYTEANGTLKYNFLRLSGHGFIFLGKY
jgi:hypothetical protein